MDGGSRAHQLPLIRDEIKVLHNEIKVLHNNSVNFSNSEFRMTGAYMRISRVCHVAQLSMPLFLSNMSLKWSVGGCVKHLKTLSVFFLII